MNISVWVETDLLAEHRRNVSLGSTSNQQRARDRLNSIGVATIHNQSSLKAILKRNDPSRIKFNYTYLPIGSQDFMTRIYCDKLK